MRAGEQCDTEASRHAHPVTRQHGVALVVPSRSLFNFVAPTIPLQVHMRYRAPCAVQTQGPVHVQSAVQTASLALAR